MEFDDLVLLVLAVGTLTGALLMGIKKGWKELGLFLLCIAAGAALGYFVDGTRAAAVVLGAAGALGPTIYRVVNKTVETAKITRLLKKDK